MMNAGAELMSGFARFSQMLWYPFNHPPQPDEAVF
jgi:hypothetical protein